MAVIEMAQVPEALLEVTVRSSEGPCLLVGRRQRALCRNAVQEDCRPMASFGAFPAHASELLSRLDRGEEAWVPSLQSSDDSADEGPVKPTLKRWPKGGMWWDLYRSPVKYPPSTSGSSEDEQESEGEEEKPPPRGGHKLTILRRNVLDSFKGNESQSLRQTEASKNRPQLKKQPRAQEKVPGGDSQRPCVDCGQAFKTKASLFSHQKTHSSEWPYECSFCGERFAAKKALASHQRGHVEERGYKHPSLRRHPKERPFKCPECEKCFKRKDILVIHQKSHTAKRPYKCPECESAFIRKDTLIRHQKIHMREKVDGPPKVEREARADISPEAPEKKPPTASVCEETVLSGIGDDGEQGTPTNLYKCQFCGRCMRTKSLLVDHERIHREEKPYKCSQCKKSFHYKHSLLQHEATHARKAACQRPMRMSAKYMPSGSRIFRTAENPSTVPTDGGKVTNVLNLSQHPRSPSGEQAYKCRYCGKCLSGSGPLTNHEKLHRRGRPYKCPDCVKRFSRKHDLLQHKATHKKQKPVQDIKHVGRPMLKSSVPERIHTGLKPSRGLRDCIVTRSVARSLSLSTHLKIYMGGKVFKCQYCGEHTRTKKLLVNHERIHRRKKKPYQCLECEKRFSQKNYLASHQRGHMRKKLSKRSNADQKTTRNNPHSHKRGNPHRRKAPWLCFKCGKCFDCKYYLTRHQVSHLVEKPFRCVCGKAFIQKWHLKRHEKTQLNKKCHKQQTGTEGKQAILNSANGVHPEDKGPGEPTVNKEPPTASSTVEKNILQDTEEEIAHTLLALAEASEMEVPEVSEQGGMHVKVQVEFPEQCQQNSLQNRGEGSSSVGQTERKLTGKDLVIPRNKQSKCCFRQQLRPRQRIRLQNCKQGKACVRWQLRSQAMMLSRRYKQKTQLAGKQARPCFYQQEGLPRRKPSLPQACKKAKTCSDPQRNLHTAASPSSLRSASKGCESGELSFCPPSQRLFSTEAQPEAAESAALETLLSAELKEPEEEVLERESKGNSDCTTEICDAVAINGQEDPQELPPVPERSPLQSCERAQAANVLQTAAPQKMEVTPVNQQPEAQLTPLGAAGGLFTQSCKEERGCAEPQAAAAATEPQSLVPQDKGVSSEQTLEKTQPRHESSHCHQTSKNQASLERHKRRHTESRSFLCTHCGKGFHSVHSLNVHTRIHTGEKPFKCSECDFRCNVSSNLSRHKRTHSREKPHRCLQCGTSFWFSHSLAIHWQMHNEKELHVCADCGQMFMHKNLLRLHRRYKHQSEAVEPGCSAEGQPLPSPGEVGSEGTCLAQQTTLS